VRAEEREVEMEFFDLPISRSHDLPVFRSPDFPVSRVLGTAKAAKHAKKINNIQNDTESERYSGTIFGDFADYCWLDVMSHTNQAPLALAAAEAFLRTIEPAYDQLEARAHRRNNGGSEPLVENPGELAPVVANIAFAIELLLKVMQIQDTSKAARGHDLAELWKALSQDIKDGLDERYGVALKEWEARGGLPFVLLNVSGTPAPAIDHAPAKSFATALERLNKSFERWRYVYELVKERGGHLYFNFVEANAVVTAARRQIREFQGNAVVHLRHEPPEDRT
jgi:HEPN domain-containing protein